MKQNYYLTFMVVCIIGMTKVMAQPCATNQWYDGTNCVQCSANCQTCDGSMNTDCLTCITNYLLTQDKQCVSSCPATTFNNSGNCTNCSANCNSCNSVSSTDCQSCTSPYLLTQDKQCVSSCPATTFNNSGNCTNCSANCNSCNSVSSTDCQSCTSPYLLTQDKQCVSSCPATTFNNSGNCTNCSANCNSCNSVSSTDCQSCTSPYLLTQDKQCVSSCPATTFNNSGNCTNCSANCNSCNSVSSTDCQSCTSPYLLTQDKQCVSSCPATTFNNSGNCTNCSANCNSCNSVSSTDCQSCVGSYVLTQTKECLSTCPLTTFNNSGICTNCSINCQTCNSASSTDCSSCTPPFNLYNNQCITTCPPAYFPDSNQCKQCNQTCATCNGSLDSNCESCQGSRFLSLTTCVLSCPAGTFGSNFLCVSCDSTCATCDGSSNTNCLTCNGTKSLHINKCVTACPQGKYSSSHICQNCDLSACVACVTTATKCTKCDGNPRYLFNNVCVDPCPDTTFPNPATSNKLCSPCTNDCFTCKNASNICTSCNGTRNLYQVNHTCLISCPPNYNHSVLNRCTTFFCSAYCSNCSGPSPNQCTECSSQFKYFDNVNNCVPQPSYNIALTTQNLTIHSDNLSTFSCGQYINIPGMFSSGQTVRLFAVNNLASHVHYRVFVWILWIDIWAANSNITLYNGSNNIIKQTYSSASSRQQNQCGLDILERYKRINAGVNHNSSDLQLFLVADTCPNPAQCGWAYKQVILLLSGCHNYCVLCTSTSSTSCSQCAYYNGVQYLLSNKTCANQCLTAYYQINLKECAPCTPPCNNCISDSTNCTDCLTDFYFFPQNSSCLTQCPDYYYFNSTTNQCQKCYSLCKKCTNYPSPCQQCDADIYMLQYNNTCWQTCPNPYLPLKALWVCLSEQDYYVNLTISLKISSNPINLTIQMSFNQPMNFSTFPYQLFQSISFLGTSVTIDKFNINIDILNSTSYQIVLVPVGIIFMKNTTVLIKTQAATQTIYTSIYQIPIADSCYSKTQSTVWNLMDPPSLNYQQSLILNTLSQGSSTINTALSSNYVQDIKMLGLPMMIGSFVHLPAMLMITNIIYPQSFYQGTRLFASFVLLDVPNYQQSSALNKSIFGNTTYQLSKRLLAQTNPYLIKQWRLARVGLSGSFINNSYGNIIILSVAIVLLVIVNLLVKFRFQHVKFVTHQLRSYAYTLFHKVHEVIIFFFTISIILQIQYFTPTPYNIASAILCLALNLYLLAYNLKTFYSLHAYKLYYKGHKKFAQQCAIKYGSFLKWTRYEEIPRKANQKCLPLKYFIEPSSYHILSYSKIFLMLIAVVMFYDYPLVEIGFLITLQVLDLIRFILTRPYHSRIRNVVYFFLDFIILALFIMILVMHLVFNKIQTSTDLALNHQLGASWLQMGWVSITLLWLWIGLHIIIWIINFIYSMKYTNKQLMDQNVKQYYEKKIRAYEACNVQAPPQLFNQIAKNSDSQPQQGVSLNNIINNIQIQLQSVIMKKIQYNYYQFSIDKITVLRMQNQYSYQVKPKKKNSTRVQQNIEQTLDIRKQQNPVMFQFIEGIFKLFKIKKEIKEIQIKTFAQIDQNKYSKGQIINIDNTIKITHQVLLGEVNSKKRGLINLKHRIKEFPMEMSVLESLLQQRQQ